MTTDKKDMDFPACDIKTRLLNDIYL